MVVDGFDGVGRGVGLDSRLLGGFVLSCDDDTAVEEADDDDVLRYLRELEQSTGLIVSGAAEQPQQRHELKAD
jgi:hypothetical protein